MVFRSRGGSTAVSHPQSEAGLASGWPGLGMKPLIARWFIYFLIIYVHWKTNMNYVNNNNGLFCMCSLRLFLREAPIHFLADIKCVRVRPLFWEPGSALRVFKGLWGRWRLSQPEQRDICPALEGFHASGRPDDLGPPGLPAARGSQRVNLTQMDPHVGTEHTPRHSHTRAPTHTDTRGQRQMQVWTHRSKNTLKYRSDIQICQKTQPHMYKTEFHTCRTAQLHIFHWHADWYVSYHTAKRRRRS